MAFDLNARKHVSPTKSADTEHAKHIGDCLDVGVLNLLWIVFAREVPSSVERRIVGEESIH